MRCHWQWAAWPGNTGALTHSKSWCYLGTTATPVHIAQAVVAAAPVHTAQGVAAPVACSLGQQGQAAKLNILCQRAVCCCHLWPAHLTPPQWPGQWPQAHVGGHALDCAGHLATGKAPNPAKAHQPMALGPTCGVGPQAHQVCAPWGGTPTGCAPRGHTPLRAMPDAHAMGLGPPCGLALQAFHHGQTQGQAL